MTRTTRAVRVWDVATGRQDGAPLIGSIKDTTGTDALAFSPDGKILAAGGAGQLANAVQLFSVATHRQLGKAPAHGRLFESLANVHERIELY